MGIKAALYLRVSTNEQTTFNQELILKEFCKRENIEIYQIYKDEGVSGSKTTRPELDRMLQDMRNKRFECVVVWKFDRLGRNTAHLLQVLQEMQNKGVNLICTKDHLFQEFIFEGEEFRQAKFDWLRRVDQYYNEREKNNESIPSTQGSENNS